MKTLLEAAKAVMLWADTTVVNNNSERTSSIAALEIAEQIMWRRKARRTAKS